MVTRFSNPAPQFLDANGDVYASGKLVFYDNGTTTPKNVYSDVAGTVSLGNELTLDASGRVQSFFGSGTYRVRLLDSSDVQIWERDDVIFDVTSDNQFNDWDSATTYAINDVVQGSDGNYYISLTNSNLNNNPVTDLVNWSQINLMESYNANKTYSVGDLVIASDGYIYRSKVNSNVNNDPTVSPNEWGTATSTVVASAYPKGYIYGYTLTKDAGDTDHDINFAVGAARDSDDTANIGTTSAFIKRIDANWTEGTNGGGFPSALSLSPSTTYNVFVLLKNDETAVDGGVDTSATAANLLADATDYDKYRKIGEITTDATSNLDLLFTLPEPTQTEQEAGASHAVYVTPATQHYHPSACKAFGEFDGYDTTDIGNSYNLTSVTDNGVGDYTMNLAITFSSTRFVTVCQEFENGYNYDADSKTTSSFTVDVNNSAGTATDVTSFNFACFGDI